MAKYDEILYLNKCKEKCFPGKGTCYAKINPVDNSVAQTFCKCRNGYFGKRCQNTEILFTHDTDKDSGPNTGVVAGVVSAIFAVLLLAIITFFVWRRYKKIKKQNSFRHRVQTRSSIEGITVVPGRSQPVVKSHNNISQLPFNNNTSFIFEQDNQSVSDFVITDEQNNIKKGIQNNSRTGFWVINLQTNAKKGIANGAILESQQQNNNGAFPEKSKLDSNATLS